MCAHVKCLDHMSHLYRYTSMDMSTTAIQPSATDQAGSGPSRTQPRTARQKQMLLPAAAALASAAENESCMIMCERLPHAELILPCTRPFQGLACPFVALTAAVHNRPITPPRLQVVSSAAIARCWQDRVFPCLSASLELRNAWWVQPFAAFIRPQNKIRQHARGESTSRPAALL